MLRLLPMGVLLACGGPGSPGKKSPDPTSGTPVGTPTVSLGTTLSTTDPIVCASPADREVQAFDRYTDGGGVFDGQSFTDISDWAIEAGSGVAVADFDGDGVLDLFSVDWDTPHLFFGDGAGGFTAGDDWLPPAWAVAHGAGAQPVDLDGDGDLDLYLARAQEPDTLLVNQGDRFTVGPPLPGLAGGPSFGVGSSWTDLDNDGDLDGYVNNYGPPHQQWDFNEVLRNDGELGFSDRSVDFPELSLSGHTLAGGWLDLDGDRSTDLYLVNDFGQTWEPNHAAFGLSGAMSVADPSVGLDQAMAGMGVAAHDLNGDGYLDLLLSGWRQMRLMVSTGGGPWINATSALGISAMWEDDPDRRLPWGTEFVDLDNDSDMDAVVVFGFLRNTFGPIGNPFEQRDALLQQQPDGSFVEVTDDWGFENLGVSRGLVVADLDDNGWLDLVVQDLAGPPAVFFARCGSESWLRLRLHQPGPNPHAIGARIQVEDRGHTWVREIRAGGTSMASGGPPEAHFGLGELESVDRVQVTWPDGAVEVFENVPTRRIADVTRWDDPTNER